MKRKEVEALDIEIIEKFVLILALV